MRLYETRFARVLDTSLRASHSEAATGIYSWLKASYFCPETPLN